MQHLQARPIPMKCHESVSSMTPLQTGIAVDNSATGIWLLRRGASTPEPVGRRRQSAEEIELRAVARRLGGPHWSQR